MARTLASLALVLVALNPAARGQLTPLDVASLPERSASLAETTTLDWLVDEISTAAAIQRIEAGVPSLAFDNGLVRRTWTLAPNVACTGFDDLSTGKSLLRSVRPEARLTVDGHELVVGGLDGQGNHAFLRAGQVAELQADPRALQLVGLSSGPAKERVSWKRLRHHAPDVAWPPRGVQLRFEYALPDAAFEGPRMGSELTATGDETPLPLPAHLADLRVSVHYELYDGIPVFAKWLEVHNASTQAVTVDRFTVEELAVTEEHNWVEARDGVLIPRPESLHVETDFSFGGFTPENSNRHVVHWREDPHYATQVNYLRRTPCLLVVEPTYGPSQDVAPGDTFVSFHTFELAHGGGGDRERTGLARRRMLRTLAPWVTENPLMHHMRTAEPEAVRRAIDDAAAVGFELVLLSFGSGFHMESDDPAYIEQWKQIADYGRERGIELGGYSLLSSRRIGDGNDVVSPEGSRPTHGNCPALTSAWGQEYYRKLHAFFEATGFLMFEHDGPYPGDVDVTPRPPLQKGVDDSRWVQWRIASDFYAWCRGMGISINAPDHYYWNGTTKCGMGYRETNWSLPRDDQVLHTRQNIFDGTWDKTPSMGWMFVPLSEYHGGGAAATIEPLHEHLGHYERMLASNLGLGVQACYRGPRLFDTPETKALVAEQVAWFKRWRDILESDVIHGRRADGRDVDWMLHANPRLDTPGMLVVYNPLDEAVTRELRVDLYYTGVRGAAKVAIEDGASERQELADGHATIRITVPPRGMSWAVIRPEA